jgi:chitinase
MKRPPYFKALLLVMFAVLALPKAALASAAPTSATANYKKVGYFIQWGMYERGYRIKQVLDSGAAAKLTHMNYAFANVSTDSTCYEETRAGWGDASADYQVSYTAEQSVDGIADGLHQSLYGHFNQIKKLKAMYPKLKVLMSIGGFTWSGRFSDAATPEKRAAFVRSCIDLFLRGNIPIYLYVSGGTPVAGANNGRAAGVFDGIDIDWEYPASPGYPGDPSRNIPPHVYRPEDTQNYTALLAEFRKQLDELGTETGKHYLLTIAAPAGSENYSKIELEKVHPYLDWMNLMTYDIYGAWDAEGPTDFQAALYSSPDSPHKPAISVDLAVKDFLARGVPSEKIVMGVPFYGRGWTNVPDINHGLYQTSKTMAPAPAKYEDGIEDYRILAKLDYPKFRDPLSKAMWIFDGKTWWNYDDPEVIAEKMAYIKANKLGGAMFWSLDGDDEQGTLITAIDNGLK